MKVIFTTNIDAYTSRDFPTNFGNVPSKGHFIKVNKNVVSKFSDKKFPTELEVVSITWEEVDTAFSGPETTVYVELHYKKIDLEFAKLNNINLF